jgi:hypothetical protein
MMDMFSWNCFVFLGIYPYHKLERAMLKKALRVVRQFRLSRF